MARSLKKLHMGSCIEDLQREAEKIKLEHVSVKMIISSADKLYSEAEKKHVEGDEEMSYLFFYRYLEAIGTAQKKDDFKKEKTYYQKLISKSKLKIAVERLDSLSSSLQKRYGLEKQAEDFDMAERQKEYKEALENQKNIQNRKANSDSKDKDSRSSGDTLKASLSSLNGIVKTNGVDKPDVQANGISPNELKNMLEQKAKRILLVDCRDQTDFTNNHINHSNCICIPATALSQGMSANKIQSTLKLSSPQSYMDWNKRGSFDFIILYDWNSSFDYRSPGLNIVYDALTKWDQDCKNAKILVVQGGMKNMYYTYPNLLTNPQTTVNTTSKPDGNGDLDLRKLESISYPDLDEASAKSSKSRSADPETVGNMNSNSHKERIDTANTNSFHLDVNDVPKPGGVIVDRSTKPTRLSSQKIPNGTAADVPTSSGPLRASENVSAAKTELHGNEYSQALDAVIASTKSVLENEEEVKKLAEKTRNERDREAEEKLRAKELEADNLRKQLDARNVQLEKLKSQYEATLREQKSKHILPRMNIPVEEEEIATKQMTKQGLDELVRKMRKVRLEDAERKKREEQLNLEAMKKADRDNESRLPPIPNSSTGSVPRVSSTAGTPQLPIINNSSSAEITAGRNVPSSSSIAPSIPSSRPVSQDSTNITRQKLKDENSEPPRSSALKRSHSHPNIAQSHDDDMTDDHPGSSQIPKINRGTKPSGHRAHVPEVSTPRRCARNFEVVSSTEMANTGLKNLGNTCYMNSIIQCLSHTPILVEYLRNGKYKDEWHPSRSLTKGDATEELAAAVKQMHSGHRSISLLDLKSTIGKYHRSFRGYEQQDSHEFITILLDWIHEEMNRVPEKTPLKEQKNDGLSDEEAAMRAWDDYKRSNDSKISELFCGQQKSCVTCANCSRQSVTFEPFYILSVPIPSSGRKCDIRQCIDFYTTEEQLPDWNCVHCKRKGRATKKIDLWRLPTYLIIHFQRFYLDGYWKKRLTEIDFPVENLNLNQKVLARGVSDKCPSYDYQLYGVSNHYGSMDGGHYTAYCRLKGNWWKFDDQEVCRIDGRDVPTAAAYIMFYQNRNC